MTILTNKQIKTLVYLDYTRLGKRTHVIKNGEILNVTELTSPMRDTQNMSLSKKEPHISFYNGTEGVFIPVVDIIKINYA